MTQTFRHKAQKFAEQLVTEVFAAREGSVPAEPAGEPPSLPEELRTQSISPDSTAIPLTTTADYEALSPSTQEPQAYRDESRVSEFGELSVEVNESQGYQSCIGKIFFVSCLLALPFSVFFHTN